MAIAVSVLLQFTVPDNPNGIFKLLLLLFDFVKSLSMRKPCKI